MPEKLQFEWCPVRFCPYYKLGAVEICENGLSPVNVCTFSCVDECAYIEEEDYYDARRTFLISKHTEKLLPPIDSPKKNQEPEIVDPNKVMRIQIW
jgi:hypothetical protein